MELTRDKCEKACLYLLGHCYEEKKNEDGTYEFTPSGFVESEIFKQLINEHFDNSLDFKAFKLPGDSTLRANTKEILISYIHALYQNWGKSDRWFERSVENNEILLKENKELLEAYKELKDSYDELLATSVKLQEGICTCCEYANPPLKFEDLKEGVKDV